VPYDSEPKGLGEEDQQLLRDLGANIEQEIQSIPTCLR